MADTPLITFIVPAYNIPHSMLRECIDSILSQPLRDDEREIIVVDDGSNEPVPAMDGVKLIRQENAGQSAARNTAMDVARGEWLSFVDSDDYLLPAWSLLVQQLHDESIDVIRMGVEQDTKELRRIAARDHLLGENLKAAVWRYIVRRSKIGNLRFTSGTLHEDEEFTPLMLAGCQDMLVVGHRCYYYRQRSDSIMHHPDKAHVQRRLNDMEQTIMRLNDRQMPVLHRRIAQLTMDYVYNSLRLERSLSATGRRISRLHQHGLWPLPKLHATWKYSLFRLMSLCIKP